MILMRELSISEVNIGTFIEFFLAQLVEITIKSEHVRKV